MIKEFENIYRKFGDKKSKELYQLALYTNLMQMHSFYKTLIEREPLKEKRTWEYKQDLILFGCGIFSEFCLNYFKNSVSKVKVIGFCDNNLKDKQHLGLKLIPLKELKKLKDKTVMITVKNFNFIKEIRAQLLGYGFKNECILDYNYFASDKRLSKYVDSVDIQYFDKRIVKPKNDEIFIDCGAFTGDSIERFIKYSNNEFQKIIAFEPDKTNFRRLQYNTIQYNTIQYINAGVYSRKKIFYWDYEGGSSARFSNKKTKLKVNVNSIDNVLNGKKATFIKMDVEGAELEALKGAKNTIIKYKPTLAICVYHKINDLIDIPTYISELVPSYKFYLRCYDFRGWEMVLYAIPN